MLQYAPTVNQREYRLIDTKLKEEYENWRSKVNISFVKNAPMYFNSRFILRFWSGFMQEMESLSIDERYFAFFLLTSQPMPYANDNIFDLPSYFSFSSKADEETATGEARYYRRYSTEFYDHERNQQAQQRERIQAKTAYNPTRNYMIIPQTQLYKTESYFTPEYFMVKTVFWLRYCARVFEFATPQIKARIREMLEYVHASGFLTTLLNYEGSAAWERDKVKLIEHLSTPIVGFRVKYGRVDASIKEYWGV